MFISTLAGLFWGFFLLFFFDLFDCSLSIFAFCMETRCTPLDLLCLLHSLSVLALLWAAIDQIIVKEEANSEGRRQSLASKMQSLVDFFSPNIFFKKTDNKHFKPTRIICFQSSRFKKKKNRYSNNTHGREHQEKNLFFYQ